MESHMHHLNRTSDNECSTVVRASDADDLERDSKL